jgi:hypothetical protein
VNITQQTSARIRSLNTFTQHFYSWHYLKFDKRYNSCKNILLGFGGSVSVDNHGQRLCTKHTVAERGMRDDPLYVSLMHGG